MLVQLGNQIGVCDIHLDNGWRSCAIWLTAAVSGNNLTEKYYLGQSFQISLGYDWWARCSDSQDLIISQDNMICARVQLVIFLLICKSVKILDL